MKWKAILTIGGSIIVSGILIAIGCGIGISNDHHETTNQQTNLKRLQQQNSNDQQQIQQFQTELTTDKQTISTDTTVIQSLNDRLKTALNQPSADSLTAEITKLTAELSKTETTEQQLENELLTVSSQVVSNRETIDEVISKIDQPSTVSEQPLNNQQISAIETFLKSQNYVSIGVPLSFFVNSSAVDRYISEAYSRSFVFSYLNGQISASFTMEQLSNLAADFTISQADLIPIGQIMAIDGSSIVPSLETADNITAAIDGTKLTTVPDVKFDAEWSVQQISVVKTYLSQTVLPSYIDSFGNNSISNPPTVTFMNAADTYLVTDLENANLQLPITDNNNQSSSTITLPNWLWSDFYFSQLSNNGLSFTANINFYGQNLPLITNQTIHFQPMTDNDGLTAYVIGKLLYSGLAIDDGYDVIDPDADSMFDVPSTTENQNAVLTDTLSQIQLPFLIEFAAYQRIIGLQPSPLWSMADPIYLNGLSSYVIGNQTATIVSGQGIFNGSTAVLTESFNIDGNDTATVTINYLNEPFTYPVVKNPNDWLTKPNVDLLTTVLQSAATTISLISQGQFLYSNPASFLTAAKPWIIEQICRNISINDQTTFIPSNLAEWISLSYVSNKQKQIQFDLDIGSTVVVKNVNLTV